MPRDLFKGIAVVIDDELDSEASQIVAITHKIREGGGYVVPLKELPVETADFENFKGASFFIMDWQLHAAVFTDADGAVQAVQIPAGLARMQLEEKLGFLKKLGASRLAPIFIFTAEPIETVTAALEGDDDLHFLKDEPSHIFVMSKEDVIEKGVFEVLHEWAVKTPSVLALKSWEREYEKAKNDLFVDFYSKSVYWPALLWQTFVEDGIPPSDELGHLITRNLFSRMTPFHMDMATFLPDLEAQRLKNPGAYREMLIKVLEGERFVRKEGLHEDSIAPGDVFKYKGKYWLNIRPDCDCITRDGDNTNVELYLLKGEKASPAVLSAINVERGLFHERDAEAIVFSMVDGDSVVFKFKDLYLEKWQEKKERRIGRLLAPFLTRVQQRYSSYLQRPGLPKIPKAAMPDVALNAAIALQAATMPLAEQIPNPGGFRRWLADRVLGR
jgi:hypothetical protein